MKRRKRISRRRYGRRVRRLRRRGLSRGGFLF